MYLGYDVIAQAQSGTGKTATFAISILQQIELDLKATQALVLAPTRELAQQVSVALYRRADARSVFFRNRSLVRGSGSLIFHL